MAVVNVRIDDDTHEQLKKRATEDGVTLSEYIRNLISEEVAPIYEEDMPVDMESPETLSPIHRRLLANSFKALASAAKDKHDKEYYLKAVKVFEEGLTGEYGSYLGLYGELSKRDCARVLDILDMFRAITFSCDDLEKEGTPVDNKLRESLHYHGFDYNDSLEGRMAGYIDYLTQEEKKWTELLPQIKEADNGNSHMPMLSMYLRMLAELRRIRESRKGDHGRFSWKLNADDLQRLANAQIHPSIRHRYPDQEF